MKRIFLVCSLAIISLISLSGQAFTLRSGMSVSNMQFFIDTVSIEPNKKAGFLIGLDSEFELNENLYLSIGSDFVQKGYKVKADTVTLNDFVLRINYLNLPVNLRYKFDLEDFWMTFEAGPYFGIGLSARPKPAVNSTKLNFGNEEGELNLLDYGFNLGFAFEVDDIRFGINYSNGLNNISSSAEETLKNRCFTVSIGLTL